LRIAYFTDTYLPQINGVTNTLRRLGDYLNDRQIEHMFFAPEYEKESSGLAHFNASPVTRFKSVTLPFYQECRLSVPNYAKLSQIADRFQPDLIHLTDPLGIGLAGLRYARERQIPVVSSFHTNFDTYLKYYKMEYLEGMVWALFQWFHRFSEMNFCPSQTTMNVLAEKGIENLALWSRGVDSVRFNPDLRSEEVRRQFLQEPDQLLYLYVGRIAPEKDLDILTESIKLVNSTHKTKIRFVMVGGGPYTKEMQEQSDDNVLFTGYMQGQELSALYASCDAFVFPSSTETFGNVVLEAMASGLPVITVNSGGVIDNVFDGQNGLLCEARDAVSLAAGITKLADDSRLRETLAANALAHAATKSWSSIFDQLVRDYDFVLEKNRANLQVSLAG